MKTLTALGIFAVFAGIFTCGSYNSTVGADQAVQATIGDLDAAYQRRADLVPNLVKTVEGAAVFEKGTFVELAEARAKAGALHVTAADLNDPKKLQAFEAAQAGLASSLGRLIATAESYPQLHATETFRDLMTQLEGTENRIQTERHKVNEAVRDYNAHVLGFPGGFVARGFGYAARTSFQAAAGAEKAPTVQFGGVK